MSDPPNVDPVILLALPRSHLYYQVTVGNRIWLYLFLVDSQCLYRLPEIHFLFVYFLKKSGYLPRFHQEWSV